ncbi:MAG: transcription-repair coupling factor [Candidatus Omnitrophota bacterium]
MFDSLKIYTGEKKDVDELVTFLDGYGYARCLNVSVCGDYSLTGDILTVYPVTFEFPVRIDVANGVVRSIKSVDLGSFKTITEHNGVIILPAETLRRRKVTKSLEGIGEQPIDSFVDIEPGDMVVHVDYGIGRYLGLKRIPRRGRPEDHFVIEYKGGDKLYVDKNDLHKLQRYVSFHRKCPELNSLNGKKWQAAKQNAAKGAAKAAKELLELQAERERSPGFVFSKDNDWQKEVEEGFPYKETPDQIKALIAVKKDMERARPMDRLLCGDVGYGKTEIALRAAFKAVMDSKQVAFLVPTTILAEQHLETFAKRLRDYPVKIEMMNRFRSPGEQKAVLEGIKDGTVDIVIGTHRLLSEDIEFHDLGLLIIDEEQRFGVRHKEKIKKVRTNVDVLTLTATPIPRTLYMALMGGRDISMIETPPIDRMPIRTEIIAHDKRLIGEALREEMDRKGQSYYVHNRVETIEKTAEEVKKMVPEARIMIGHGQMSSKTLEKTMMKFIKGEIDILVCTTIIESGIDIPNANTMIVDDAYRFGLADLYQLRGRIGRFDRKAYAYLVVRDFGALTGEVRKRLEAMKKYQDLGSGFKIAMRDLEMRGAGNILGMAQSGFIDQIGFDLYCRLLKTEISVSKRYVNKK